MLDNIMLGDEPTHSLDYDIHTSNVIIKLNVENDFDIIE